MKSKNSNKYFNNILVQTIKVTRQYVAEIVTLSFSLTSNHTSPFFFSYCLLLSLSHVCNHHPSLDEILFLKCVFTIDWNQTIIWCLPLLFFLRQMSAYLEGRTTRLSSTETSRSRSSQEDFLCGDPPAVAAEPQYHPGPLGGGTTHSGRKPGGSNSSDVQYRCDPVEVCVMMLNIKLKEGRSNMCWAALKLKFVRHLSVSLSQSFMEEHTYNNIYVYWRMVTNCCFPLHYNQ